MDNLTHSLVGALFGQMGLKRRTGLAMPTLIIAANIPDIDATCTVFGMRSLAMRRGITHGPIAMVVLPIVLAVAMLAWDRWQQRRGKRPPDRPPVRFGWLLALAYLGCLSHPFFDWLNSYGIRLLEPFSHRWFYGDALFIVDPWLWAMLIAGLWFSQRRERARGDDWSRPAWWAFVGIVFYISLNLAITARIADRARLWAPQPTTAVVNPVPLAFWRREVLWRTIGHYNSYSATVLDRGQDLHPWRTVGMNDPRIARRVAGNPDAQAFLFWSRLPVADAQGDTIVLRDQRFQGVTAGRFAVELKP